MSESLFANLGAIGAMLAPGPVFIAKAGTPPTDLDEWAKLDPGSFASYRLGPWLDAAAVEAIANTLAASMSFTIIGGRRSGKRARQLALLELLYGPSKPKRQLIHKGRKP